MPLHQITRLPCLPAYDPGSPSTSKCKLHTVQGNETIAANSSLGFWVYDTNARPEIAQSSHICTAAKLGVFGKICIQQGPDEIANSGCQGLVQRTQGPGECAATSSLTSPVPRTVIPHMKRQSSFSWLILLFNSPRWAREINLRAFSDLSPFANVLSWTVAKHSPARWMVRLW